MFAVPWVPGGNEKKAALIEKYRPRVKMLCYLQHRPIQSYHISNSQPMRANYLPAIIMIGNKPQASLHCCRVGKEQITLFPSGRFCSGGSCVFSTGGRIGIVNCRKQPAFPKHITMRVDNYKVSGVASKGSTPRSRYNCSCFFRTSP